MPRAAQGRKVPWEARAPREFWVPWEVRVPRAAQARKDQRV